MTAASAVEQVFRGHVMSDEQSMAAAPSTGGSKSSRMTVVIAVLAIAVAGGGGAVWYLGLAGNAADSAAPVVATPARPPIYYTLDDNFIVNFSAGSGARYLQLGIDLMARDPRTIDALRAHAPVLRNRLILLLSDQSAAELETRDGKEALQVAALAEVHAVMSELHSGPPVESLYFTTFVMQ